MVFLCAWYSTRGIRALMTFYNTTNTFHPIFVPGCISREKIKIFSSLFKNKSKMFFKMKNEGEIIFLL